MYINAQMSREESVSCHQGCTAIAIACCERPQVRDQMPCTSFSACSHALRLCDTPRRDGSRERASTRAAAVKEGLITPHFCILFDDLCRVFHTCVELHHVSEITALHRQVEQLSCVIAEL